MCIVYYPSYPTGRVAGASAPETKESAISRKEALAPPSVAAATGPFSQAIAVNEPYRLVFISGQVAVDAGGNLVGKDDVAAQCVQVFENIAKLMQAGGGTMADVFQFRTYLTDRAHLPEFLAARAAVLRDLFPNGNYPTSTLLIVAGLVNADYLLEVEATAAI